MEDARRILQPVSGATGKKANVADFMLERRRSHEGFCRGSLGVHFFATHAQAVFIHLQDFEP
jgi:hypothetical protein